MKIINTPLANAALQDAFLVACSRVLPREKYIHILHALTHTGTPSMVSNLIAYMPLRNDFGLLEYTTDHRLIESMSKVITRNREILAVTEDNKNEIISHMIELLRDIFGQESHQRPGDDNQALHTLAKLVLAKPAEFNKIFIQLTPGEGVAEKVRYLYDRGVDISLSSANRYLAKEGDGQNHNRAMRYLEFLLREKYPLGTVKIEPCDSDCIFLEKQRERIAEVEKILGRDKGSEIPWNVVSIDEEAKILSGVCRATIYRWAKTKDFSIALLLGTCNELPKRREKK